MLRILKAECMKYRRSPIFLALLILPVIPAVLGTLNYIANQEILTKEWTSLWTQHTLFSDYFFLPVTLGVCCAWLLRLEHIGNNWNKLFSLPLSRTKIFVSKLITAGGMLVLIQVWICALFIICGKLAGLGSPPWAAVARWCLFGSLGGMVMVSAQLALSSLTASFALPVGVSFAGGLSGLFFLAKDLGHIWPYSLMAYGMNANAPQELLKSGYAQFVLVCLAYTALFSLAGAAIFRRDV